MSDDKCSPIVFCVGMRQALYGVPENFEGKGLSVSRGWLGEEKTPRKIGVTYRQKAHADGIILNFCPWCGASIRFDQKTRESIIEKIKQVNARPLADAWATLRSELKAGADIDEALETAVEKHTLSADEKTRLRTRWEAT